MVPNPWEGRKLKEHWAETVLPLEWGPLVLERPLQEDVEAMRVSWVQLVENLTVKSQSQASSSGHGLHKFPEQLFDIVLVACWGVQVTLGEQVLLEWACLS